MPREKKENNIIIYIETTITYIYIYSPVVPARVPKTKIVWDFYFLFLNIKRKKQITMNFFIFFDEIHGNR